MVYQKKIRLISMLKKFHLSPSFLGDGQGDGIKFFFLFFSFSILLFYSCENDISKLPLDVNYAALPVESSKNVRMILSDSAKVKIILTTPLLDVYNVQNNPYFELKEGLEVNFYNDSMRAYSKVTANYAIRYPNTGITEAKGNVIVINEKGEQLNTEHLTWNEKKQIIYTD
ncbi:MAG: LPS export ABC transporter periplasmic protein LptC [Bacteroidetes bacterium RIFCSPLOWO2_12_FULL_31_6]|nr:MAG: LPS export ABC transporter periplasmic protein LptC [Bacteroidetes bacterium RIFCSPLOWO2_12_FULL_31_6]